MTARSPKAQALQAGLALARGVALLSALGAGLGCHGDEPKASDAKEEKPAATEQKPAVDQKIASAMAAAEASAQRQAGPAEGQPAPPRDGIIGADAAARELPPGSPAQVVFGGAGSEPRLRLGPDQLAPGARATSTLQLTYHPGGSMTPNIDFELEAKTSPADAAPSAVAGASPPSLVATRFTLVGAKPAASQPGRLPDNAKAEIAKLKGSWIQFTTTSRGDVRERQLQVQGGDAGLEPFVTGTAEALSSVLLAYPTEPVGAGGFWMVKSRETADGADVLAYRMVKVTSVEQGKATLSVSSKRYLINPSLAIGGLPPHRVRQFQGEGEATLSVRAGAAYPESAQIEDHFVALVSLDERPNQAVPIQSELQAKFASASEATALHSAR